MTANCNHEPELTRLRVALLRWEEFDFERDNPKRLVEHVLALMVERDTWRRKAEAAEAVVVAITSHTPELCRCGRPAFITFKASIPRCPGCEYQPCATCDCVPERRPSQPQRHSQSEED